MIRKIELTDFQSHAHTILDLHEGVNVVVGSSDSGKTAILRALGWVVNNRPVGTGFIRYEQPGATVLVETDSCRVERVRGGTRNVYTLDGAELRAVGTGVPEEVNKALGMDAVNIQAQHDRPFLLSDGPAEVARTLNRVAGLEDIDQAQKNASTIVRRYREEESAAKTVVDGLEDRLKMFSGLNRLDAVVTTAEAQGTAIEGKEHERSRLSCAIEAAEEAGQERGRLLGVVTALEPVAKVGQEHLNKVAHYEALSWLVQEAQKQAGVVARSTEILYLQKSMEEALGLVSALAMRDQEKSFLETALSTYNRRKEEAEEATRDEARYQDEFTRLMPDQCPLCGK